jgi:transitional endoplasmic reticulum ATPase
MKLEERAVPAVTYEDIGGMRPVIHKVREMIEIPLRHPELFERLGVEPPKGVLLYGSPGTGKTLLAKAVANESGANFISISGPEVMSKWYGQSEENLRKIFEEAEKNAPTIIFIDEIDSIAPKREEATGEVERRVVSQLLTLMDGLKKRGKVMIIAATNRPNAIDPALRRPGRFDREIEIPVPDREGRLEILKIHTRNMPLKNVDLTWLSEITYGYVGADLWSLAKEAAMSSLRRILPEMKWKEEIELPKEMMEKLIVTKEDFEEALKVVEPSAMREVLVEVPKVKWTDIGGLEDVKQALIEMVEWPLKNPKSFEQIGIQPPKGILLYGPPGTGKTLLAKAVANESGANFISVKGPELKSKWVGESERMIRELFRRARQVAPCIIFFDEIDALAPRRGTSSGEHVTESIVSQLLTELSGLEDLKGVVVIAATNRPDIIDPGLLRPGRFDRHIMVSPPDEKTRLEILKVYANKMPLKNVNLEKIARETEGFSGADLESLCREAAMNALREDINSKEVKMKHFEESLRKVTPSISKDVRSHYEKFVERQRKVRTREEEAIPAYIG